jgi:hypothetical protein
MNYALASRVAAQRDNIWLYIAEHSSSFNVADRLIPQSRTISFSSRSIPPSEASGTTCGRVIAVFRLASPRLIKSMHTK